MIVSLKYWNGISWSYAQDFNVLYYESEVESFRESGLTLNYQQYNHLLAYRWIYQLVISADELIDADKMIFIRNFYIAQGWKLSLDNWTTEKEIVLMDNGKLPKDLIDNIQLMPEITLILVDKEPSLGELI